jgi:hypothetical protein
MTRALVFAAMTLALPPACEKLMVKKGGAEPAPTGEPPPVTTPVTSATTPPVWVPPVATPPPVDTTQPTTTAAAPAQSPEFAKAREAAEGKDWKKVRTLLEKRVKGGKATPEEAQLLFEACAAIKDKACISAVTAKYPGLAKE